MTTYSIKTFKNLALRTALLVEELAYRLKARFKGVLNADQPLHVIAFHGFGNKEQAYLSGRVLVKKTQAESETPGRRANLRKNYARFNTHELAGIAISGKFGDCQATAVSDDEGYFTLTFDATNTELGYHHLFAASNGALSLPVELNLPDYPNVHIDGDAVIMVPNDGASFGIISDVDDTLMITNATSLLKMLKLTLLGSAESRIAFAGIAEFYAALHKKVNPFFYVSSSPWNLYTFLTDFMQHRLIVPGPIMLRDFGIDKTKFIAGSHTDHKLEQIRRVFVCYPKLSFILSGDSGQDDPQIYTQIAQEYPDRIKAIYIRDAGSDAGRIKVQALATQLAKQQITMLLISSTVDAAAHAAQRGFISAESLQELRELDG